MDGFEEHASELKALGIPVVAASVDPLDKAKEIAEGRSVPIGYGVTRENAEAIGAWWEDRRSIVQPSEFVLDGDGRVLVSSYSDGPLGRIEAGDVIRLVRFYEKRKREAAAGQ